MLGLQSLGTREDIARRVCALIAEQMAIDSFEVKESDSIDQDLGIAGTDVGELFAAISSEFGTDFSELDSYFNLYFYPEFTSFPDWPLLLALSALIGATYAALNHAFPQGVNLITVSSAAFLALVIWRSLARHRAKQFNDKKLRITVSDLIDAVVAGKWSPPKDIWQQIERLGQKKQPASQT